MRGSKLDGETRLEVPDHEAGQDREVTPTGLVDRHLWVRGSEPGRETSVRFPTSRTTRQASDTHRAGGSLLMSCWFPTTENDKARGPRQARQDNEVTPTVRWIVTYIVLVPNQQEREGEGFPTSTTWIGRGTTGSVRGQPRNMWPRWWQWKHTPAPSPRDSWVS